MIEVLKKGEYLNHNERIYKVPILIAPKDIKRWIDYIL